MLTDFFRNKVNQKDQLQNGNDLEEMYIYIFFLENSSSDAIRNSVICITYEAIS